VKQRFLICLFAMLLVSCLAWASGVTSQAVSLITSATVTAPADDALALIATGKTQLEQHNILAARDAFQAAVAADASNQEAQLLYGVTRVLAVYEDGQATQTAALDSVKEIGELSGLVFSLFGLYDTQATMGEALAATTPTTGEVITFLTTKLLPQVEGAIANLQAVSNPAFSSTLQPSSLDTISLAAISVDYADAQVIKAMLYAIQSKLELLRVYGLNANLPNLLNDEVPNLKRVRDLMLADASFLAPVNASRLTVAKNAFVSFADSFTAAVAAIRARSIPTGHLFVLDQPLDDAPFSSLSESVDPVLAALVEIKASLAGAQHYTFVSGSDGAVVDLSKFFNAASPVNFRSMLANCTTGTALPDNTLGGIFPLGLAALQQGVYSYHQHILGAVCSNYAGVPMAQLEDWGYWFYHNPADGYVESPQYLELMNNGSADLSVSAVSVTGRDAGSFRLFAESCPAGMPLTLQPGTSCSLGVEFVPESAGEKQAVVELLTNDPTRSVITVPVNGTSVPQPVAGTMSSSARITAGAVTTSYVYAAFSGQGVFRSSTGTGSWTAVNNGLQNLMVTSLVADPSSPATLYAGTYGGGVFKTTNNGDSWSPVSSGLTFAYVTTLAINPSAPATLYAGTYGGLFKTTNGGVGWSRLSGGLSSGPITSIAVDPADGSKVYCLIGGQDGGLYASADGGASWQQRLASFYDELLKVVVGGGTPGTVLVTGYEGLRRSTDAGLTWTTVSAQAAQQLLAAGSSLYAVSYGGSWFASSDNGATWVQVADSFPVDMLMADPNDASKLYSGAGATITQIINGGETITPSNLPTSSSVAVKHFAVDPRNSSIVYAAAQAGGVLKSVDGGQTWNPANSGLEGKTILTVRPSSATSGLVLAGTQGQGLYRSTDGGASWTQISNGISSVLGISDLLVVSGSPEQLFAATGGGVYRSLDGGVSWSLFGGLNGYINTLAYGNGYLYAASSTVLYRGLLSDGVLQQIGSVQVNQYNWQPTIASLLVLPGEQTTVYLAQSDGVLVKSTNGGALSTVTPSSEYGTQQVLSLASNPQQPSTLYAGAYNGVYYTTNGGVSWSPLDFGLWNLRSLAFSGGGSHLVAGTYDRVYRIPYPNATSAYYPLNLTISGSGMAFSAVAQFGCATGTCTDTFDEGTLIELAPEPGMSSVFSGWSGCDSVVGDVCQVRMTAAKSITASFVTDTRPLLLMALPPGGSYQGAQSVALVSNKNVPIYYTLNGSDPTQASSYYSGPIDVAASATLKYRALDNGTLSSIKSEVYSITPSTALLTVERAGTAAAAGGSITPSAGNLDWSGATGSASYALNTSLSLTACSDADTSFGGWSGCDSITAVGDCLACNLTLSSDRAVGATFNLLDYVRLVGGGSYGTIKTAHDAAGAAGGTLWGRAVLLSEGALRIDWPVILRGGYAPDFSTQTDFTTLQGTLTIGDGSLAVDRLIIR